MPTKTNTRARKSPKSRTDPATIPFINNKGRVIHMKGSMTIGELTRIGIKVSLVPRGTPLAKGQWKPAPSPLKRARKS